MKTKPRYLTKSRFKIARECPTKLYYTSHKEYGSTKDDNDFLKALAEGGFQVGELAKLYYPGGTEVDTLDYDEAIRLTNELLIKDEVIIYEAAILFENLFVRVDILKKTGKNIQLIEVKSKSFNSEAPEFWTKKGTIASGIRPYLEDLAFQTYVAQKAFPGYAIMPFLMLSDTTKRTTVNGLNQRFMLIKEGDRTKAVTEQGLTKAEIGEPILTSYNALREVSFIHNEPDFETSIKEFAEAYANDVKIAPKEVSAACKGCEFRIGKTLKDKGLKSGFDECWMSCGGLKAEELEQPLTLDLYGGHTDKILKQGKLLLSQVEKEDIGPEEMVDCISNKNRRWLHVDMTKNQEDSIFVLSSPLRMALKSVTYPLHFIDFETTRTAIPFNMGRRCYEQVAFQFSHHTMTKDGKVEHAGEWINTQRGEFPNFDFIRALRANLDKDNGTIFRYSHHENSVLRDIYYQLEDSSEKDKDELQTFIRSITRGEDWEGERNMVDLCEWAKDFYFDPRTKGSNSIKQVLPSIINRSKRVQEHYSLNPYSSKNFKEQIWIVKGEDGKYKDPYKLLEPVMSDIDQATIERMFEDDAIAQGGAAMTAYARMQFSQMSEVEVEAIRRALLRYCELDTLAMVMLWMGFEEFSEL